MSATLSGTLFLYQGEEIGMTNIPETWNIEDLKDISSIQYWNRMKEQSHNDKDTMASVWKGLVNYSRDNARTPVQWTSENNGGCRYFSISFSWKFSNVFLSHYRDALDEGERESQVHQCGRSTAR